jgi:anthranilate synthase component 2
MKILVFDNYDSFTYNLVQLISRISGKSVDVFRNDQIGLEEINAYDKIVLSPGPGVPAEAGLLLPLIREYASKKSILGVCLGHQAIGEAFGAKLVNLSVVYHGVATEVYTNKNLASSRLFEGMPERFEAGRYHSWIVGTENFPESLEVTAFDDNNYIMALRHKQYDVEGVQFHPESVLTPLGEKILRNWLKK